MDALISQGFCPKVIRQGRRFKLLSIEELNVKFIPSYNYFPGDEFEIAKLFNIKFDLPFFPCQMLKLKYLDYNGKMPTFDNFLSNFDTPQIRKEKKSYYERKLGSQWCFLKEILSYSELKIQLLILGVLTFLKESMIFQQKLQINRNITNLQFLNPFSTSLISLSSFVYTLFRLLFLNNVDVRVVQHEYGFPIRKVSRQEFDWTSYWIYQHPDQECFTAFNNPKGQKYFPEAIPDLYVPSSKHCYFYNGCFAHSHYEDCSINKSATGATKTWNGRSFKDVNDEFWTKLNSLILNNPDTVDAITVIWECQFQKLKESEQYKFFEKNSLLQHPLVRLTSRDCYRGAYFDVCCHKWSSTDYPTENLYFIDVSGLYSYCSMENSFMTGTYKIIMGKDLKNVEIVDDFFYYLKQKINGAILLTIVPPKSLLHPFLLYKTREGKTILTLCKLCCEKGTKNCLHSDEERALTGSYMISEIEYALKLNYKIVQIFE